MTTTSPVRGGPDETPPAPAADRSAAPGLVALSVVMSMLALAISIVAIVVAGIKDDEGGPPRGGGGPTQTLAVELGDLYVEPDRVEVPAGTDLVVEVTNRGELVHTLNLNGETGTDRLQPGDAQTADFGVIDADTQAWCTVPGHKEAGMVLDIVVTSPPPGTEHGNT